MYNSVHIKFPEDIEFLKNVYGNENEEIEKIPLIMKLKS
jgi:hypothetical protein